MAHAHDAHGSERPAVVTSVPDNVVYLRLPLRARLRSQWPSLSVQTMVAAAVLAIFIDFRLSMGILAAALGLAFMLRMWLPKKRIGWLAVRRKHTDLLCLALLLLGVVLVAVSTPVA